MIVFILAATLSHTAVDSVVHLVMRTQSVAGMSVGLARAGVTVYTHGYGMRDLGRGLRSTGTTVYRVGSLTKSFTAEAVLELARNGAISLNDPAARYIERFPWSRSITIEQLLTHESGIPSYSDNVNLPHTASYTPDELIDGAAELPVTFEPGRYWMYSNTNYILLGMMVERQSGMPYGRYVQQTILDPLGLRATRYGDQRGQARGYARDTLRTPVPPSSVSFAFSAAGLTSNVPDLLRWVQFAKPPYYGWFESDMDMTQVVYASGSVDGFSSVALICPQTRDAVVVLANADRLDLIPLVEDLYRILTGRSDARGEQNHPASLRRVAPRNPAIKPAA